MRGYPGLDGSDLVQVMDPIISLAEIMRVARIRPVHPLQLEAEIIIRRLWIERPLRGQQYLIEQQGVGLVGEQMPEIQPVARIVPI